tara:strand:- start:891 stop:1334 length:444 start_codon:yes stop_codon:yes gene_type:complete
MTSNSFVCPACGLNEVVLENEEDIEQLPYVKLATYCGCDQSKNGSYIFGDGHTQGFGGIISDFTNEGESRKRFIPPRGIVSYHFLKATKRIGHAEPNNGFYNQPLFRNLVQIEGNENVFVSVTFLPHGEKMNPEMRKFGEQLAKKTI